MHALMNLLIQGLAVFIAAYILPGVKLESFTTALVVAVVLGIVNWIIKPVLVILTLPITVLTMGFFYLVINAFMVMLVSSLVPGFKVQGFWVALLFSLVLSLVSSFLHLLSR